MRIYAAVEPTICTNETETRARLHELGDVRMDVKGLY
jgi:hypothetical protein